MERLPIGFRFAGGTAGIKDSGTPDLAVVISDRPAAAVGMFTTNRVCAAPVQVCRARLPSSAIRGIVVNSGNANACTGVQGLKDAEAMCNALAAEISCEPDQVLVASTGVIGRALPTAKVLTAVATMAKRAAADFDSFHAAASAILTTDTRSKTSFREIAPEGHPVHIAGFCKGAAMIGPNMATMLAFLFTDACVGFDRLASLLRLAIDRSFHCIGVDGHTSTNDSVLLVANGGDRPPMSESAFEEFSAAVESVCTDLARQIVADAEGATKFIALHVTGCRSDAEARAIARAVAMSPLVKAAMFGNDPNWGRICSAAGYAGVEFEEKDLSLWLNGTVLFERGAPVAFDPVTVSMRLRESREVEMRLDFGMGTGECAFWTSDLSTDYVRLNAEYTT